MKMIFVILNMKVENGKESRIVNNKIKVNYLKKISKEDNKKINIIIKKIKKKIGNMMIKIELMVWDKMNNLKELEMGIIIFQEIN